MRKTLIYIAFILLSCNVSAQSAWDKHMEVKKMDIRIQADLFTATTYIEIEFYNPNTTDIEGLYGFGLKPGQVITGFQLDLNGKFREGSIEEKWKARAAYNTIVGKRVDPALLNMDYPDHYSLRIFPIPAMGSRRISMTIQQLLPFQKDSLFYDLPLSIRDTIQQLNVNISIAGDQNVPVIKNGLLANQFFKETGTAYQLAWEKNSTRADSPVSFSIPLPLTEPAICLKRSGDQTFFALRIKQALEKEYKIRPEKLTVFWDISMTGERRDTEKEIIFLKEYLSAYKISSLTIIPFNHQLADTAVFDPAQDEQWISYLRSLKYEGAKEYGLLDFSKTIADVIFVFSDGRNSIGKDLPVAGKIHVFCINAASRPDSEHLQKIIGNTGGMHINLNRHSMDEAVDLAGKAENILLDISSSSVNMNIDQDITGLREEVLFISGTVSSATQELIFHFGNRNELHASQNILISDKDICEGSFIDRTKMLQTALANTGRYDWQSILEFGQKEKIVTLYTSFIVLEKLDDYIKYKITPPKELESQCDMNYFVDAAKKRKDDYVRMTDLDMLAMVAESYNAKIAWWNKDVPLMRVDKESPTVEEKNNLQVNSGNSLAVKGSRTAQPMADGPRSDGLYMTEVVVTALGQTRQPKEMGYSVSKVKAYELASAKPVYLVSGLTGKVSGLNVQTVDNGVFANTRITLRGIRSLTGNNQPLLVVDGLPLPLSYVNSINVNDVADVTILRSVSAAAIYGPDGVNGALIVTLKKGSRYGRYISYRGLYKLKECEDVDYLTDIKSVIYNEKIQRYYELKKVYGNLPGFYLDMAEHLFKTGYKNAAMPILLSAADAAGGDVRVLKAIGYMLESWKRFDEAIRIYQGLVLADTNDIHACRDLALSYFQNGQYQQSVDVFYNAIKRNTGEADTLNKYIKSMMLQEMNAVIAVHKNELDLSQIDSGMIRPLAVDLRITIDYNCERTAGAFTVMEPGGETCQPLKEPTKNGGSISADPRIYFPGIVAGEYQIKKAKYGTYRIRIAYADTWYYGNANMPVCIKIMTFKNMGRPDQSVKVENVIMDNQFGQVEISEVKW